MKYQILTASLAVAGLLTTPVLAQYPDGLVDDFQDGNDGNFWGGTNNINSGPPIQFFVGFGPTADIGPTGIGDFALFLEQAGGPPNTEARRQYLEVFFNLGPDPLPSNTRDLTIFDTVRFDLYLVDGTYPNLFGRVYDAAGGAEDAEFNNMRVDLTPYYNTALTDTWQTVEVPLEQFRAQLNGNLPDLSQATRLILGVDVDNAPDPIQLGIRFDNVEFDTVTAGIGDLVATALNDFVQDFETDDGGSFTRVGGDDTNLPGGFVNGALEGSAENPLTRNLVAAKAAPDGTQGLETTGAFTGLAGDSNFLYHEIIIPLDSANPNTPFDISGNDTLSIRYTAPAATNTGNEYRIKITDTTQGYSSSFTLDYVVLPSADTETVVDIPLTDLTNGDNGTATDLGNAIGIVIEHEAAGVSGNFETDLLIDSITIESGTTDVRDWTIFQ